MGLTDDEVINLEKTSGYNEQVHKQQYKWWLLFLNFGLCWFFINYCTLLFILFSRQNNEAYFMLAANVFWNLFLSGQPQPKSNEALAKLNEPLTVYQNKLASYQLTLS
jgi:hypothetical protein